MRTLNRERLQGRHHRTISLLGIGPRKGVALGFSALIAERLLIGPLMAATEDITPAGADVGSFDPDELAELIIDANTSFETNQHEAKRCIQRALQLVRPKPTPGAPKLQAICVRGGLAVWQMTQLMTYIESNIEARILVSQLAAVVRLSVGHFFRAFKTSFGMCPQDYIMRRRISRAEVLMRTSTQSLASIALECGLCDQAHFSKSFRRIVGVSPNIWRRQWASDQASAPRCTSGICEGDTYGE